MTGAGCVKTSDLSPAPKGTEIEHKSAADLEKEQMFSAAREYIKANSVAGMEVELKVLNQIENYALLEVTPINIETDIAQAVMEKVNGKWVCRDFGTALPGWEQRVPELFK